MRRICALSKPSRPSSPKSSRSTGRTGAASRQQGSPNRPLPVTRFTRMPERRAGTPLLFLSHAGADTEAARKLKQRLETAPVARERGLKVWFDKDDLQPGAQVWQVQLEEVLRSKATFFVVYVGSKGVVNW